jgi:hypothetical protein
MKNIPISLLAVTAIDQLDDNKPKYIRQFNDFTFAIHLTDDSLWVTVNWPDGAAVAFRTAYAPDVLIITKAEESENELVYELTSAIGKFKVVISFLQSDRTVLHYRTTF